MPFGDHNSVSVVIPCHNSERWLASSLDSVARQVVVPREVVVVVDASKDGSARVAAQHHLRPTVVETTFRNAAAARNHGVSLTSGEWVAFLDADDWWLDGHLEEALNLIGQTSDVAYFGNYTEYFEDSEKFLEKQPVIGDSKPQGSLSADRFYDFFLGPNPGWPTSAMVVRRTRFNSVGGFDVSQVRRHDTELFARVVHGQTWTYNPKSVFVYRKDVEGAISTNAAACAYYRFLADLKICKLYGLERAAKHLRYRAVACMSALLQAGGDYSMFRSALPVCSSYLDGKRRAFYHVAKYSPSLFGGIVSRFSQGKGTW